MSRDLLFSGENRKRALTTLIRAYDDVAAVAEAAIRADAEALPAHRVVLIHAERGLGKTRLAMELYRHLTGLRDGEGYWPNDPERLAAGVAVMPRAELCDFSASPSFLWWGMAIQPPPHTGSTIFNSLEDLLPHLTSVRIAARRRHSGRAAAAEFMDLAGEAGLEVAEIALEATPVIGYVKRVGEGMWKIGNIVRRHLQEDGDARRNASDRLEPVIDSVMADLDALFNPRSRAFARSPLVVFVDDSQFVDWDQTTAIFLERLIARSARDHWPMLLVLTHWSRQLNQWQDGTGAWQPISHVAEVLRHARHGSPSEPGRFAAEGGGSLAEKCYLEIDLGEPATDLTPALADRFPGIGGATVAEIVQKSGNNPRKLEQIVARMEDNPVWFYNVDASRDLTAEGRSAVLKESNFDIDTIVAHRFDDTPKHVRRALTLASSIGYTFVVELVDRLSVSRLTDSARPGLEEGESRYRFVRDIANRSRNDIGGFSERLFFDAAKGYRSRGKAHVDLAPWPSDEDIFAGLDELLGKLVDDPASLEGLSDDDLVHALGVAADRLIEQGSERAGLALARLVRLENGRGNFEGANEAAARFIAGFAA